MGPQVQDGPYQVGPNLTFSRRWTQIVTGFAATNLLLFYDATSGVGAFYATDGKGNLALLKQYDGWRHSWNIIIGGSFGRAGLMFYDAAGSTGEFYSVDNAGNMALVRSVNNWRSSWYAIVKGRFSGSKNDDLLFYDRSAGVGQFYKIDDQAGMQMFSEHDNWRTTWRQIVPGSYTVGSPGLLFQEDNTGYTELYSVDVHGSISQIDVNLGDQWLALPWQNILAGLFTPNIGLATDSFCNYDAKDGALRDFYFWPATITTAINLNGTWASGGTPGPVISAAFTSLTVDMSAYHRPPAHGSIIDGTTITVTFPDDGTYTGKLELPNVIAWSNGSAWTKV